MMLDLRRSTNLSLPVIMLCLLWTQKANPGDSQVQSKKIIDTALSKLEKMDAQPSSGTKRGKLHERIGDAHRAVNQPKRAYKAYQKAFSAFSSAGDGKNRLRLLRKLSKRLPGWPKPYQTKIKKLHDAWKKVKHLFKQASRLPRRPTGSDELDADIFQITQDAIGLAEVAKNYHDRELLALALHVEGRTLAAAGYPSEELSKYRQAADACGNGACPKMRKSILEDAANLAEKQNDLNTAFVLFALINHEANSGLPEVKRRYQRSKDMVRVCSKLVSSGSSSSCMKLEQKATGFVTFRDFSTHPPNDKLSREKVREVHDEYLPLLVACLRKATKEGEIEPGELLELSWTVLNTGSADKLTCYPSLKGLELDACFRRALEIFRYPRYRGERQNVTLPLSVSTR